MSQEKKWICDCKLINNNTSNSSELVGKSPNQVTTTTKASPQQRAFSNALIVRQILSFIINFFKILNLRKVSKVFEAEATSLLLAKDAEAGQKLHVKFTRTRQVADFQVDQGSYYEHLFMGTLTEFVEECWRTSRRFPASNFTFDKCNYEANILDFFKNAGGHIKQLSLTSPSFIVEINNFLTSTQVLASILFDWTPNLKHLTLVSTPWLYTHKLLDPKNAWSAQGKTLQKRRVIPSLESLTLLGQGSTCSFGVVQDIIESAPNLQLILDPTLKFTEVLVACKKLHLGLKVIDWDLKRDNCVRFYAFTDTKPQHLQKISINFNADDDDEIWPDVGRALTNIFQGGHCSLEKIGKLPLLHRIPNLESLPIMEKVTELEFRVQSNIEGRVKLVPDGQTLQQVFPQLNTLRLYELSRDTEDALNPLFQPPHVHCHDGVTSLEVAGKTLEHQSNWYQRSSFLFPNLTVLQVGNIGLKNAPEVFRAIWFYLDCLEHLKINVIVERTNLFGNNNLPFEMDSAITGIPVKLCKQLRRNLAIKRGADRNVDYLRKNRSILNLYKLKTFEFKSPVWRNELFTLVSSVYAVEPMIERQQLKTNFPPFSSTLRI